MTSATECAVSTQELLAYWLGELDGARESAIEEHLFGCASCPATLGFVADLGAGVRCVLLGGELTGVLPAAFVERLKAAGVRVREYRLEPGGSVDCTITRDDDLVVASMRAPLEGVGRLDVLIDDSVLGKLRLTDVAFDARDGGIVTLPSAAFLRTLDSARQHVRLVAVDGVQERVLADYTFNHYRSL